MRTVNNMKAQYLVFSTQISMSIIPSYYGRRWSAGASLNSCHNEKNKYLSQSPKKQKYL